MATDIDDGRSEFVRVAGPELQFKVLQLLALDGVFFGFRRSTLRGRNVCRSVGQIAGPARRPSARERAVHKQVGIAPDGACEVRVVCLGKAVVSQGCHPVGRPLQAFEKLHLEEILLRLATDSGQHPLHLVPVGHVPHPAAITPRLFAKLPQSFWVRYLVDAVHDGHLCPLESGRDRFISGKHTLFNELMGRVVLNLLQPHRAALIIQPYFDFGKIQIQRTAGEPLFPQNLCQFPSGSHTLLNGGIGVTQRALGHARQILAPFHFVFENCKSLPVGEARHAPDHRPGKP